MNTQWVIGKNNHGKTFYVAAVDKYGAVMWTSKRAKAIIFENEVSADTFRKLSLKNRTDVFISSVEFISSWMC